MTETSQLWQVPVTYAAVGATQADDLLQHPPRGFRPMERRVRVGYGAERWDYAWLQTLSWGIQRRSGFRVAALDSPAEVSAGTYSPVAFDQDGVPVQPATSGAPGDITFAPDGSALIQPGDTALLKWMLWPARIPARVVYVIDEPDRKGFGVAGDPRLLPAVERLLLGGVSGAADHAGRLHRAVRTGTRRPDAVGERLGNV
jgi:uncharacterized protein (UPF0548 family)